MIKETLNLLVIKIVIDIALIIIVKKIIKKKNVNNYV